MRHERTELLWINRQYKRDNSIKGYHHDWLWDKIVK